ncbi:MAG: helix-turn-helix transcriptional regulator [Thermodesulfovibrionales bacterium]|nr:helix-turn-helix transcriptional regulator [Thermodesulfovibrionales bacterium]
MKDMREDIRKRLGMRIRELRKSAGMTQEELGERASLNYKFIGELERGRVNVSIDSIARIAGALGVRIGDLFSKEKVHVQKILVKEKKPLSQFSPRDLDLIKKSLRLLIRAFLKA